MTAQTVDDCINDINKENFRKLYIENSTFYNLLLKTKNQTLNSLVSFFTVMNYEKIFYKTQGEYTKKFCNCILPALQSKIVHKEITTADSVTLDVWDINPYKSEKYIILCSGIGSEKSNYYLQNAYSQIIENGYAVIAFDYRGRGRSNGIFCQKGALRDVFAVYNNLIKSGIKKENIGIMGHSMGCGVALDFCSRVETAFTVLINPFNNAAEMAKNIAQKVNMPDIIKKTVKRLPAFLIPLKNKFNNEKALKKVKNPVLIVHSSNDPTIPAKLARKLYESNKKNNVTYKELFCDDHEITSNKINVSLDFIKNLSQSTDAILDFLFR